MRIVRTVNEVYEECRAISYAVHGLVPEASLGLIFGESSAFKTFVALDYLLHRSYGMPWCGLETKKAIGCFVSAEGSAGVWKRIKAWHDARMMSFIDCPLRIVPRALALPEEIDLLARDFDEFKRQTGESFGDLAVDTFSQTFSGNENQADNVSGYFNVLRRRITQPHRCVTSVLHHTGRSGENPRGSYAFEANLDWRFKLERQGGERITTLTIEKQKDDLELPPLSFSLTRHEVGTDSSGHQLTSLSAAYIADPAKFAAAIAAAPDGLKKMLLDIAELGLPIKQARSTFYDQHDGHDDAKRKAWSRTLKILTETGLVATELGKLVRRNIT